MRLYRPERDSYPLEISKSLALKHFDEALYTAMKKQGDPNLTCWIINEAVTVMKMTPKSLV